MKDNTQRKKETNEKLERGKVKKESRKQIRK
jgi:hypothetical protein